MSILDNEGHDPNGLGNTRRCPLCNDTGEQRYWEGRWRDEAAQNDRLRFALQTIHDTFCKDIEQGYKTKDKAYAVEIAKMGLGLLALGQTARPSPNSENGTK